MNISLFRLTNKSNQKITAILINILVLSGLMPYGSKPASAQTLLTCEGVTSDLLNLTNNAVVRYSNQPNGEETKLTSKQVTVGANITSDADRPLQLVAAGVEDLEGNALSSLGAIAIDLTELYEQQGLSAETARTASIATVTLWASLSSEAASAKVVSTIKSNVAATSENPDSISTIDDSTLLTILAGFGEFSLRSLNLSDAGMELALQTTIVPQQEGNFIDQIEIAVAKTAASIDDPAAKELTTAIARYYQELEKIREGSQTTTTSGSQRLLRRTTTEPALTVGQIQFKFRLDNQEDEATKIELPNAEAIAANGLTGSGTIAGVSYRFLNDEAAQSQELTESKVVSIPAQSSLELKVIVAVGEISPTEAAAISVNLEPSCGSPVEQSTAILPPIVLGTELIDPLGQITGCAGEILPEYQGFVVALYDPDPTDPTGSSLQNITPLTGTELPDDPDNSIPKGIEPNTENSNPFFLTNTDEGRYSFLFDDQKGQLDIGATYILLVSPPEESVYNERRVKLVIGERNGNIVKYTASSLDGRPISTQGAQTTVTGEIVLVEDAERVGLNLAVLDLSTDLCDAQEIQITKSGDRATAEPGDIVLYRLSIRNLASAPIDNLQITDILPAGMKLEPDSVKAEVEEESIAIETTQSDRTVNFSTNIILPTDAVINLVYAAQVTPNALRGSGENSAIVNAQRIDNDNPVKDGPAIHTLRLEPGIIEDAGTLIGRVFVDKNFDGEQQPGEPGIPNATIYLENGNRIITDPDGLFSVTNVLPGNHTGTLDLTSIPEYRLAPNLRFIEGNSTSRLVRLEPGGLVRMNFGVMPTAAGKKPESRRKIPTQQPSKPQQPQTKLDLPNSGL